MEEVQESRGSRFLNRRLESKGLRPRVAASVLAIVWLVAIVVFGLAIHLLDPDSFSTFWEGSWWATQTVTTVGYGDVVPADWLGKLVAMVLMIGGLSFFAVITGLITTEFVTRADAQRRGDENASLQATLTELRSEVATLREDLAKLSPSPERVAGPGSPPPGADPPAAG